jgi:hypothetical protein
MKKFATLLNEFFWGLPRCKLRGFRNQKKIARWSWIWLIQNLKYRIRNGTYLQCCLVSGFEISILHPTTSDCCTHLPNWNNST